MRHRPDPDRGTSLVEISMVLMILVSIAVGLAEIGFLGIDYMTATNAARSGARTGSTAADSPLADISILEVMEEDVCNLRYGEVERITIYRAEADGSIPFPPLNSVNEYVPKGNLDCDTAGHAFVCDNGCPWDPATLRDNTPPTFDKLGVEVTFSHTTITGLMPWLDVTWSESAVMQLEPDTKG